MTDYYDNIELGEQPVAADLRYLVDQSKSEENVDFLGAAFQEAMSPFAINRMFERRSSKYEADENWTLTKEAKEDLYLQYSNDELDYLEKADSEPEFLARKGFIKEDRDRQQAIANAGAKGIVANLAFSMFDPIGIAIGIATGGLSWGTKATGITKALRIATLSGIENAAIETLLVKGNTQSNMLDTVGAFAGGALIGGALSPLVRSRRPDIADLADEADAAVRADAENLVAKELTKDFPRSNTDVDSNLIRRKVNTKGIELKRAYDSASAWSNKKIGEVKSRIKSLEKEIEAEGTELKNAQASVEVHRNKVRDAQRDFIKKAGPERERIKNKYADEISAEQERIKKIEKSLEKKDTTKKQAKLWKAEEKVRELEANRARELAEVEARLKGKVNAAEFKLRQRMNKLARSTVERRDRLTREMLKNKADLETAFKSRKAGKELKMWNMMTEEQKARSIFKEGLPTKSGKLQRHLNQLRDINETTDIYETADIELGSEVELSTVEAIEKGKPGSVGAAAAGDKRQLRRIYDIDKKYANKIASLVQDGYNVPKDLRGWRLLPKFTEKLSSIQNRLSNSENLVVRGLSYHLFEAPQGGSSNPNGTAALMSDLYGKKFRTAMRGRLKDGMEVWRKNQGISRLDMIMKPQNTESFYKKVILETKYPGTFSDEGIKQAAQGVRDQFRAAGAARKAAGEAGFENLDLDKNYVSTIVDEHLIKHAVFQHGKEKVIDLLSDAYQRGRYNLDKKTSDYIARGYVARSLDHTLGMSNYAPTITSKDVDKIRKSLESANVPKDVIDEFLEESAEENLSKHMSNRAKKSFEPDLTTELDGLKMVDLIESDLPKLLEAYTREAAGASAMGRLGFKSRNEAMEFLREVKKDALNLGMDVTATNKEVQILEDGINLIYGRSINTDPNSAFIKNLSRLRDATAFLRLQTMGISTIPELARITGQRGLKTVMEACPDLGVLGSKSLREGGTYAGKFKRADLDELEDMLYYVGEDYVMYPGYLRIDNIEESAIYNSLGGKIDNMLAQGKRVQEVLSAFRTVQGSGEKLAVRSLGIQIKKWADDLGKGLSESNIKDAGWHGGFMDELKAWMQANPKTTMDRGKEIRMFNFGQMPPEMQERLITGIHRLVSRDMQRPFIGETPVFMHKWLGQLITQFRSFSITSLGKQLIHDIRHDRIAASIIAMHSLMLSYAAYSISALHRSLGRKDQEEYLAKAFSPGESIFGTLNRMGQLASAGVAGDMLATFGVMPDDLMAAPGQSGYRGLNTTSVPVVGVVGDAKDVIKDVVDIFAGDGDPSKMVKDIQSVIPFGKAIGINQAFNAASGALD